ncbi:MAG: LuxR C-terminal-related transcriptional regulator [Alphaproteobacteria bacterium]
MMGNDKKISLSHDEFMDLVATLEASKTIGDLLIDGIDKLGVKHSFYQHYPAVGAVDYNNYAKFYPYNTPKEITDYYLSDNNYNRDPVAIAAFTTGQFIWLSDSLKDPIIKKFKHEDNVRYSLKAVGDGMCFPLYGPDNRKGYAFAGFGRGKADFDPIFPYQIQSLLQLMHVRYCRMIKSLQRQVKLTSRESEVLEFMSFGKTNSEIGTILGISPRTVAVHASKIFLKLGTEDRVAAALRAQTIKISI